MKESIVDMEYMVERIVIMLTIWTIGSNMFHKMIHNFHV